MQEKGSAVKVLHITDCHLNEDRSKDLLGMNTYDSLIAVLDEIKAEGIEPDCILVTGDISQDGSVVAYQTMKDELAAFNCPIRWFPGNHDHRQNMSQVVGESAELEKVLKLGAWQLVLLDSLSPGNVHGELEQSELDVLSSTLNADNAHALVCLHHHPVEIGALWLDRIGLRDPEAFLDIVDENEHVEAVLWGHIHQEFDEQRKGKRMLATPSTCIQFKPKSDEFGLDELAPGYRWLNLYEDGSIETKVKRANSFEYELDLKSHGY